VANFASNNVTVIDGATNTTVTVTDANAIGRFAVAVNPVNHRDVVAGLVGHIAKDDPAPPAVLRVCSLFPACPAFSSRPGGVVHYSLTVATQSISISNGPGHATTHINMRDGGTPGK